jgi:hypothetical protein
MNDGDADETNPLVNPGAYEIVSNGLDDECNPLTSDSVPASDCAPTEDLTEVIGLPMAAAMELCQTTAADPPQSEKMWGVIYTDYGTVIGPLAGATMAGMSTGRMPDAGDPGHVAPQPGSNFAWNGSAPPAYLAALGGNLPSSFGCDGTCASGSDANDSVNLRLTIRVPTNAQGFTYQFRCFCADYRLSECSLYNDFHLALLTTGAEGMPADTKIAFDSMGNPPT